ncbi:ABC transporter permease [Phyllobacterium zundukense]|uniref:ABC transporter permease n=1 Tax=Phyllobacterium zundukense TaxID=1867719 RepID=A0A2N9VY39_9HYPH|nr:ABC transporter permease [Phyllobacterium zundukense]ATU95803.1 ABC transporter permease [Phyllobacterium zundukense]PIO44407.1 ABC transporter permease [Phyllobacterium zundukense]
MRAYPLTWRLLDVLEAGVAKVFPRRLAGATPYLMLAPAVLLVGLLVLGLFQIADGSLRTLDTTTFLMSESYSLDNFRRALSEPLFRNVALKSFAGSLIVTAITLILALPYGYVMVRTKSAALRKTLLIALFLPFFIGQVVRAYGWLIILGNQGLVNEALSFLGIGPFRLIYNYPAVLFGLIQYMLPFAVLMLAPALTAIPEETEAAAESLGANWIQTFIHVVLPMARPGFVGAGLVVMTLSLTDFAIPAILGGGSQDFIANAIYDQFFRTSDQGLGATLALLLVAAGSTLVAIVFALVGTGTLGMGRAKQ